MNIESPWSFISENYHIALRLNKKIKFSSFFGEKNTFNKETDKIVFTFSDVTSSINKSRNIKYNEFIIKLETEYLGEKYYYPAITFVNNEFSIIRGYFLGYYKKMANLNIDKNKISFIYKKNSLRLTCSKNANKNSYHSYPFLLYRKFKFDNSIKANDCVSLQTQNYTISQEYGFSLCLKDLEKLLSGIGISIQQVESCSGTFIKDSFIVTGVKRLNGK